MPYEESLRLTASGTLWSTTPDIFNYSFALRRTGPQPPNTLPTSGEMDAITAAVKAFHINPSTKINANAILTKVKVAALDPAGHYTGVPIERVVTGGAGGSSAAVHPSQVAWCVSLRGTVAVRPARGRFYLPLPACALDSSGRTNVVDRDNLLGTLTTLYNALQSAGFDMAIRSGGAFGTDDVREIRVGRVLDTQRRRRNAIPEDYGLVNVVPT